MRDDVYGGLRMTKANGTTPTVVRLPAADLRALRRLRKRSDLPMAWHVRRAVREYLERQGASA